MNLKRGSIVALVLLISAVVQPLVGQDDIDVVIEPNGYVAYEVSAGRLPGDPSTLRSDLDSAGYELSADIDGDGNLERVERLLYQVRSLTELGRYHTIEVKQVGGQLHISLDSAAVAQECDPHLDGPPDGCSGSGIPAQFYGPLNGKMKAFLNASDSEGFVVRGARMRVPAPTQQSQ